MKCKRTNVFYILVIFSILCLTSPGSTKQDIDQTQYKQNNQFGNGILLSSFWTADDSAIVVNSSRGLWIYSTDFEPLQHLETIQQTIPSPTDDLLAGISSNGKVILWTINAPNQRTELPINDTPSRLFFSRDGSRLAVVGSEQIWLWDIRAETLITQLKHEFQALSLDWSPNNDRLVVGGDEGVIICEVSTIICEELPVKTGFGSSRYLVSWGPDGNQIAIGKSNPDDPTNTLELWDISTKQLLHITQAGGIVTLHWDWSENLITTSTRLSDLGPEVIIPPAISVWAPSTGELINYVVLRDRIFSTDWNHDHTQLMIADEGNLVMVQEVIPGKARQFLGSIDEFMNTVTSLAWRPDGTQLASGSEDGRLRIWDIASGKVMDTGATQRGNIRAVAWNAHNPRGVEIVYGGFDRSVYAKLIGGEGSRGRIIEHDPFNAGIDPGVWAVDVNDQGIVASGGSDGDILIADDVRPTILRAEGASVFDLEWMHDDERIVAANGSVTFWDTNTLSLLETLTCPDLGIISDVALNSAGDLLAAGSSYPICLWDLTTGERLQTLVNYGSPMAWKPETNILTAKDFYDPTLLRLWDVERGELVTTISVGTRITAIAWSPDGESIAIGDADGLIHIYEQDS
jgi:WD40 repeat protein